MQYDGLNLWYRGLKRYYSTNISLKFLKTVPHGQIKTAKLWQYPPANKKTFNNTTPRRQ